MTERDNLRELADQLAAIIERHMPGAARELPPGGQLNKRSQIYASLLMRIREAPLQAFGLGPSVGQWAEVRRSATRLREALKALEADGLRELELYSPLWWNADPTLPTVVDIVAQDLEKTCLEMENRRRKMPKLRARNWPAAAVAKEARRIWAEEEWHSKPEEYGTVNLNMLLIWGLPPDQRQLALARYRDYHDYLESGAPRSDKHDKPGPFGRFLNDVLEALSIGGTAKSALQSLDVALKTLGRCS